MTGSGGGRSDYNPPSSTSTPRSGTGGGGGAGGGGGDPCDIVETVPLNSPQPAVVTHLNVGDVLDVVLTAGPPSILEVRQNGARAGALTHRNHLRLINCITKGRQYQAVVVRKSGGAVDLRVEPT